MKEHILGRNSTKDAVLADGALVKLLVNVWGSVQEVAPAEERELGVGRAHRLQKLTCAISNTPEEIPAVPHSRCRSKPFENFERT